MNKKIEKLIKINKHDYLFRLYEGTRNYLFEIKPNIYDDNVTSIVVEGVIHDDFDFFELKWNYVKKSTKIEVVEKDSEKIDKDDFDWENDSIFVMICEYIDNEWGKELFNESTKSSKKSLRESMNYAKVNFDGNYDLEDKFVEFEIYDSTKYSYSAKELANACEIILGKFEKDWNYDFSSKNTMIISSKYGEIEFIPEIRNVGALGAFAIEFESEL